MLSIGCTVCVLRNINSKFKISWRLYIICTRESMPQTFFSIHLWSFDTCSCILLFLNFLLTCSFASTFHSHFIYIDILMCFICSFNQNCVVSICAGFDGEKSFMAYLHTHKVHCIEMLCLCVCCVWKVCQSYSTGGSRHITQIIGFSLYFHKRNCYYTILINIYNLLTGCTVHTNIDKRLALAKLKIAKDSKSKE